MFTLQRNHALSVRDQLVHQLRYHIASGTFPLHETLPSTRELAKRTDTSFHTIRKAYQVLQEEGLVESRRGSGYVVVSRGTLSKSERMEQGASIVQETVRQLIGLGMSEPEMEYLYQEQLSLLELDRRSYKLLMVAPFRELSKRCAQVLSSELQEKVLSVEVDTLVRHADADIVFATYPLLRTVQAAIPRADTIGLAPQLYGRSLDRIARLLGHETLGLIVRYRATIPHLTSWIKQETGFQGQLLASSIEDGQDAIRQYERTADYITCLAEVAATVKRRLDAKKRYDVLDFNVPSTYIEHARSNIPGR